MNEHRYGAGTVLGLLTDSHGRADTTRLAVDCLLDAGADVLIHLGDVCADTVLDALAGTPAHVVFGNCDWDWRRLGEYGASLGLHIDHPCGRLVVGERTLTYAHGDVPAHERLAMEAGDDYFLHGHTHVFRDERVGATRLINPGALFRAPRYTVVRLEPCAGRLDVIPVQAHAARHG